MHRALYIKQEPYHGEQFEGNDSQKLQKNVDPLQHLAEKSSEFQVAFIIDALRKFNLVVGSCFSSRHDDNYIKKLKPSSNPACL